MGRRPCCAKEGLNRGTWTVMEDKILTEYIRVHGEGQWRNLPKRAGLKRCGKSCRLRWLNYLRPDIKRGNITDDEEELIIRLHKLLGNRWSLIAGRLPGRTDNEIKNYWNTKIGKKSPAAATAASSGQSRRPNVSKKLNQPQKQPNPTSKLSTSSVIRTKARRCTKVVISNTNPELPEPQKSGGHRHSDKVGPNLDQIMDDFEMDQNFLSDFLNIDFGMLSSNQLLNNEGGGKGVHSDTGTLDSDGSGFFSDGVLNEFTNFPSMTSLIEGDWLQN